ncbi:MAG: CysZ protein [Phycisphaerales bacterium]|jgi:CysZ protein|nr:CysZ protein [Phycisphaerales bacterium]
MLTLLAHGEVILLFDKAIKVALIVGWVLISGLGAMLLAGVVGLALRKLLGARWVLALLLPLLNFAALVLLVRTFANEKTIVPDAVLLLFGVPVVVIVGFAVGILAALPPSRHAGAERASETSPRRPGSPLFHPGSPPPPPAIEQLLAPSDLTRTTSALIREGMTAPLAGWQVMQRYPALWRYAIIPVVLNLLITLLILIGLVSLALFFSVKLHPLFDPTWTDRLLEAGTILLLIILALGGALATYILLNGILCGYFYGKLAREVEIRLGMPADEMKEITFRHQVVDTVRDLGAVIGINLGVLALNIIPGLGTVIAFPLGAYFNALLLGKDFLDFPLALRGLRREQKKQIIREHRWQTIGLGAAAFLFQLIPILGAIVSATAVVGAVILNRRWSATPAHAAAVVATT